MDATERNSPQGYFLFLSAIIMALFLSAYIATTFEIYPGPLTRGGTETYDFNTASRNLVLNDARSIAYLFDYRTIPPNVPLHYEHAPNSHRFVGAGLFAIGLTHGTDLIAASCVLFVLVFAVGLFCWSASFSFGLGFFVFSFLACIFWPISIRW